MQRALLGEYPWAPFPRLIGRAIAPVNDDYRPPFAYPGAIHRVIFELPVRASERDKREEADREARATLARQ